MELVRISTAGSVDDGKSTLIGRLMLDNDALTIEQHELIAKRTKEKGMSDLDLSVLTDGLIAEREQGITIDVAHIYFSTEDRKFIILDSPGHIEYTRNMVTGASNSDISIILIDARKGLQEQSFRHFYISQLLQIPKVIFCVNKMDLVEYDEDVFLKIAIEIKAMVDRTGQKIDYSIIPISSLKGDNVVHASNNMDWYTGTTLDSKLKKAPQHLHVVTPFRFEVQQVIHHQSSEFIDFRGFAGKVISGEISVGDEVKVLPANRITRVKEIRKYTELLNEAKINDSIILTLEDEIDGSRGSIFVHLENEPSTTQTINAALVWMNEQKGIEGNRYLLKNGAREIACKLSSINELINPVNLDSTKSEGRISLNEIAHSEIKLSKAGFFDPYSDNKLNGHFILINVHSNATVASGFVRN